MVMAAAVEAARMNRKVTGKSSITTRRKTKLGLPDLDLSKRAVLDSLRSPESKRGYRHAVDEFIRWYCSEPRLSFNKIVVTRYRIFLEDRHLAAGTVNGRLAAVRRLAYEAADAGLLSPELAAGIRRVKGVKKLGVRLGNWLTADEARRLWQAPSGEALKGKRDRAILAILLGCDLRRRELADLDFAHLQRREEHWAIVDLVGKGGHIRTVPVPDWVKTAIDVWTTAACISSGRLFRCVCRAGKTWGNGVTEGVVWHVVKDYAKRLGFAKLAPHDLRRSCAKLCHAGGGELEQIPVPSGTCLSPDHRAIPWMQTADQWSRERRHRYRALARLGPHRSAMPTIRQSGFVPDADKPGIEESGTTTCRVLANEADTDLA